MFFPRKDFYMVERTVVHEVMQICCEKKGASLPMFYKSRTEHYGVRIVDGDKTNN